MSKPFKETVRQRASRDPQFRNETLKEALEALNRGDIDVAKSLISDCVGEACHLTENQKRNLQYAYENAEGLSLEDGGWQEDSAAVVEAGSMIMWQLEQAFPFLG